MKYICIICMILLISCNSNNSESKVLTGLDRIDEYKDLFKNKNLGIITNHTGYNSQNRHIVDCFLNMEHVKVTALFGPEHGIRGQEAAGKVVNDTIDPAMNIPVYSLYGSVRKPTPDMLKNVDVLIFDIQDIGARFYTYIYTMALAMEASAEQSIPFIVLDRPNPINGKAIEGNILDTSFASFVGLYPIPVRHGMTAGELAYLINEQGWLRNGIKSNLTVIKLKNWHRDMWYNQTGLVWRAPSPNMPDLTVATVYPGICLFEGTNISEGRGTYQPFLKIGAPYLNHYNFNQINKIIDIPEIKLGPISFIPKSIPSMAPQPKYLNQTVFGVSLNVIDRENYRPYTTGIALVKYFYDANPQNFAWRKGHFDRLCGTDQIRNFIVAGKSLQQIVEWFQPQEVLFRKLRKEYLFY